MIVQQFHIRGFRSLKDTRLRGINAKSIFHGDNGSGKSNLLLALETIFGAKQTEPGLDVEDKDVRGEKPRRSTPFWQGDIPNFGENFYMGDESPITFEILLQVSPAFFDGIDEYGILKSLIGTKRKYSVKLGGQITRRENVGEMKLTAVDICSKVAMRQKKGGKEWVPDHDAPSETKQRVIEGVLDTFTSQVRIIPASRFLAEETFNSAEVALRARSYKNWLHQMSLSRRGYQTFQHVKKWFSSELFGFGEISFLVENNRLELMVEDNCDYRMKVDQKGSGIQQMLVLLGYIAESNAAIVAVEEPELNLSFKNQDQIVQILRQLVEDADESTHQILLTSHSDHIGSRDDFKRFHVEKTDGTDTVVRKFTPDDRGALFPRGKRP